MKNMSLKIFLSFIAIAYSSFSFAQSPGGVSPNLRLWLKADAGVTTSAGKVTTWADQSGGSFNATQGTAAKQPAFTVFAPKFNGYPSIDFDAVDDGMATTASITTTPYSMFVVYNSNSSSTADRRAVQGTNNWLIGPYTNKARFYGGAFVDPGTYTLDGTTPIISTGIASSAGSANAYNYYTGKQTNAAAVTATVAPGTIHLSGSGAYPALVLRGSIAEVVAFNTNLSTIQRTQVESYLALKYGLTLDQTVATDYLNSAGATIFNAGTGGTQVGYASDVAGILVDNGSGLSQSSSSTVNTKGMLGITAPSTALIDGEYIIGGDNGASLSTRNSVDLPAGFGSRINRVWRVSKSAPAATVTLKIFIGDIPELVLPGRSLANVAILTSSSTSFASAATYAASSTIGVYNDTLVIPNVALNNNDYFTLSIGANALPVSGAGDFDFWYGVPQWSPSYYLPQKLHFTGAAPSSYSVYIIDQPANPSFIPIAASIAPGEAQIIDMTPFVANLITSPGNAVVNRGLRITVKGQVGAYYANENSANYQSFPLRGPNALGTSFFIPGQNQYVNGNGYTAPTASEFIITATEDNTSVTITPSEAILGHAANLPFTISMNKGQSYQAQSISRSLNHLAGSYVSSSKAVVVTYSDDLLAGTAAADNAGDQIVPISKYGNDYVHIRTNITMPEKVFMVGSKANTTITIFDGTTTTTKVVNAGQMVNAALATGKNVQYIHSDNPILVYQMGGSGGELGGGILTPAANCKGANIIAYQYPTAAIQVNFNFVVPAGIEGNFVINGSSTVVTSSDFLPVPGFTAWKYCRKDISAAFTPGQTIVITNTAGKFFFYQNMKTVGGGDFSNFSDFGNVVLFPKPVRASCVSNAVTLSSSAIAFNASIGGYSWTGPNGFTSSLANPVITNPVQADSGWHVITVSDNGGCPYIDSILVSVPLTSITVTPTPAAGCSGSTISFTSSSDFAGVTLDSIRWTGPNGFTSTQANFDITNIQTNAAGTYTATYYDRYGCVVSKSTTISIDPAVIANIAISGTAKIGCFNGNSVVLNATGFVPGLNYQTYNPYKASSLFASSNFTTIAPGFYNQAATAIGTTTNQINLTGLTGIVPASSVDYGVQYDGYINIATAGNYTFYVNSKDGSNLYIDGNLVVSNDGSHIATEIASSPVTLAIGYHSINCNYYNGSTGAGALSVSYSSALITKTTIPASLFFMASGAAPGGLTYAWSNAATGASTTVSAPGTYTLTGTSGACSSAATYKVIGIDSYDYGDLPSAWPSAQAKVINCVVGGVPTGPAAAVWAGTGVSYENNIYSDAQAASGNIDGYDDGVVGPGNVNGGISYPFTVTMNSNVTGKTVYFGLWFDWNNNGDFTDDVDLNGNPAFYSGSGVTASPVSVIVTVAVPNGASSSYKSRLIVSDAPVGFADFANTINNGEVEDYQALSILPVNLVSFNAVAQNCKASITWKSATEENFDHYDLEYSKDGLLFTTLSTMSGKGNNSEYNYQTGQLDQAAYFRLKSIDIDGHFNYSTTIKLANICSGKAIDIYPNPAKEFVQINLTGYNGKLQGRLYNNTGQLMETITLVNGGNTISTGKLVSGVYNLVIKNNSEMQTIKISIIH